MDRKLSSQMIKRSPHCARSNINDNLSKLNMKKTQAFIFVIIK